MHNWLLQSAKPICQQSFQAARQHQSLLTKPPHSLGILEKLAERFAGWQGTPKPVLDNIVVRVYSADHGVCAQDVSAFPQAVTAQMVTNFVTGGAAISVLSQQLGADFHVINMGTVVPVVESDQIVHVNLMPGTDDFTKRPAMTAEILDAALDAGRQQITGLQQTHLYIGGEMGIGNTTAASAIYSALLQLTPEQTVGPGAGINADGVLRKQQVVLSALQLHHDQLTEPYDVLRCLGGLEIAALTGSYIACAQQGIPVLVDGFISTAAALVAIKMNPSIKPWLLYAHESAEPAHCLALKSLEAMPLLNLNMRLGEGSGAAMAVPIIKSALDLHNGMATFSEAGVDGA